MFELARAGPAVLAGSGRLLPNCHDRCRTVRAEAREAPEIAHLHGKFNYSPNVL
jgi:hypothetical protein